MQYHWGRQRSLRRKKKKKHVLVKRLKALTQGYEKTTKQQRQILRDTLSDISEFLTLGVIMERNRPGINSRHACLLDCNKHARKQKQESIHQAMAENNNRKKKKKKKAKPLGYKTMVSIPISYDPSKRLAP